MTDAPAATQDRKPRIALMGEFSAGKSTLCNLLLHGRTLPEQVTATRLPPIWMAQAPGEDHRVKLDGTTEAINRHALHEVPFDDTRVVRMHVDADILEFCEFIDFPGISDPNMDSEVWERVLVDADAVIWLTHATQAWRQSEMAVWDTVPPEVQDKSILLVTRFDKLTNDRDKGRVMARLQHETRGLFDKIFPISLTEAVQGQNDFEKWDASGAEAFTTHLTQLIADLSGVKAPAPEKTARPGRPEPVSAEAAAPAAPVETAAPVTPRRVRPQSTTARPDASPARAPRHHQVVFGQSQQ